MRNELALPTNLVIGINSMRNELPNNDIQDSSFQTVLRGLLRPSVTSNPRIVENSDESQ